MHNDIIDKTTIYAGGDSKYWKLYGKSFVKSFNHFNSDKVVHIHLCNPDQSDLEELQSLPCNFSYEYITEDQILELASIAKSHFTDPDLDRQHYSNLKYCSKFYDIENLDDKLLEMMKFTSYACSRFIKLADSWTGVNPVIAYDIDSICRGPINIKEVLPDNLQGCLSVKGDRFVVSMVAFKDKSNFLPEWGHYLKEAFLNKKVYNFLDQDSFVKLSEKFNVTKIGRKFCDHTSKGKDSLVITGKGQSKFSDFFINEQNKWK